MVELICLPFLLTIRRIICVQIVHIAGIKECATVLVLQIVNALDVVYIPFYRSGHFIKADLKQFHLLSIGYLSLDIDVPIGLVESDNYAGGYFEYVKEQYEYAFSLDTVDVYNLVSRFEIGEK